MKIEHFDASDRAKWLAMREQDITASDIAAICGLDPYKTRLRVYAEKMKLIPPGDENGAMRRGRHFEEAAIAYLREARPTWQLRRKPIYLRAPDLRIGATPDLIAIDPEREGHGVVQIKTVARRVFNDNWRGGAEDDEGAPVTAPIGYQLQTITEGRLATAQWGCLAALVVSEFDADLYLVDVDVTHDAAWQRIKGEVEFFWRCIAAGQMPDVDPEKDAETVKALWPEPKHLTCIDLSADNELPALLDERAALKTSMNESEDRLAAIDTSIKERVGEFESAIVCDGRLVKWKNEFRRGHQTADSNPRVLRVSTPKGSAAHASRKSGKPAGARSQQPALDLNGPF